MIACTDKTSKDRSQRVGHIKLALVSLPKYLDGRHPRVVPPPHEPSFYEFEELTFGEDRVGDVQS